MVNPGAQGVLFRRSYRELEDTHILAIQKEVPLSVATYASGNHNLVFNNGSILQLRYCEQDEHVATYQTAEYDFMLFDELQQFTQYQYTGLLTRCRSTKDWWPGPRIRSGGTPGDRGHNWVMSRWITPWSGADQPAPLEVWKAPVAEGGMTRQFIPARVSDNPSLTKADPQYLERLRALPPEEYRMKALGDWNVFTGQFFTRWRSEIHIEEPFDIPPDWDRFICVDYGFNAPYAVLWFARPPGTKSAYVYREHYGKGITLNEQVYRAHQITVDASEKIRAVILDPSMFSKVNVKGERIAAMADTWRQQFGGTTNVIRGNNERVSGWRLMREMVNWEEAPQGGILMPPRLFVFRTCANLCRTLPLLICHDVNVEDVDSDGEDHAADALRYGLQHAFAGGGAMKPKRYSMGPAGIVVR
jgi:hypothetical protein